MREIPSERSGTGTICCDGAGPAEASVTTAEVDSRTTAKYFGIGFLALGIWWLVYQGLSPFAKWFTFSLLTLTPGSRLTSAVEFFVFEAPKVLMLLTLVVFAVGVVRSFFTPERARRILAGKRESAGNVLASLLGVVTPFCSCSAVPLFIGFVTSGVPLGVTFSFLVSAPMVNEIALVLLYGLFGWKIAVLYAGTGLAIAMISGWVIGRLGMESHVEEWVYAVPGAGDEEGDSRTSPGGTAFVSGSIPSGTSSGRCGLTWSPGSPSEQRFTAMCRRISWLGSWGRERGGPFRWPFSSGFRCIQTRRASSRSCRLSLGRGRRWGRCWRS